MRRFSKPTSRHLRIVTQTLLLLGFLWLFLQTEYRGLDSLPWPVSLLFRLDPLAALADAFSPGNFGWRLLWPALVLVALTALFGRFFCGWICPLGTTLDGCGKLLGRGRGGVRPGWRRAKYYLLLALAAAALFGVQLFGLFDPLSIFLRSLTIAVYPAYNLGMNRVFDFFYDHRVPLLSPLVNHSYDFFRDHLMAFRQPYFTLALFTFLVFLGVLVLEKVERRFWCKNLCPLGALLGLCARFSLLSRTPSGLCSDCRACTSECRMGAVGEDGHRPEECILCLDCTGYCPDERVGFRRRGVGDPFPARVDLSRREVVSALAVGAFMAPVVRIGPEIRRQNPFLLRPPGAVDEPEFLRRCIRCGECMKVCIGGALHPAFSQAGAVGLWTPLVIPRIGYCEYNCTLCGQVCPTGAIRRLALPEKQKAVIGLAVFDKDRCLPWAKAEECLVCEEHCPTGEKAIVFEEREVTGKDGKTRRIKLPKVIKKRCVGCGICETRCPLEGRSAIVVINEGESRRPRADLFRSS
jgi:MauM/NapG family ferredoxin protein